MKKYRKFLGFAFMVLASMMIGCAHRERAVEVPWGACYRDVSYGAGESKLYDIYMPSHGFRGAMLFIHGGSWMYGDKTDMENLCRHYAAKGFLAATMNYSLAGEGHPVPYFQMLDEITECLEHLKTETRKHGIPLDRIALSGYSAGGHLAMLYAYTKADIAPLQLAFVAPMVGPTTFEEDAWKGIEELPLLVTLITGREDITLEGYRQGKYAELIKAMSPALNISENSVPTVCAFALKDELVGYIHAERLVGQLRKYNVPHVLITYLNSGHGLENDPECNQKFEEAVLEFSSRYLCSGNI